MRRGNSLIDRLTLPSIAREEGMGITLTMLLVIKRSSTQLLTIRRMLILMNGVRKPVTDSSFHRTQVTYSLHVELIHP